MSKFNLALSISVLLVITSTMVLRTKTDRSHNIAPVGQKDFVSLSSETTEVPRTVFSTPADPILPKVESLESLEYSYLNYKSDELQIFLDQSKQELQSKGLLEKANHGVLSPEERRVIVIELRKQGVLATLLAKQKLKEVKDRYL